MSMLSETLRPAELGDRIRDACSVTAEFLADIIGTTSQRFAAPGQSAKTARVRQLIQSQAWTDAALALL
ncbi:MAG: hypothetical protein ABJA75_26695, partial [Bradyrhizobium sp.]